MDKNNSFIGLLCFISFVSFAACGKSRSQMTEYSALLTHQLKIMTNFQDAMDIRLKLNGKFQDMGVENPLREITHHYTSVGISKLDDYLKACSGALNKFNKQLSIEPKNVTFKSFYYKMLKWLLHHTSRIRNSVIVLTTSDFDDTITNILSEIETLDIRTAFDGKIFDLQDPWQMSLFGKEIDNAVQLIYDIESREFEVNDLFLKKSKDPLQVNLLYGRTKYYEIVSSHHTACSKVDVYENFLRKLSGIEDYTGQNASFRSLTLIGLIDAALIISAEGSTPHFMYENISLKSHFPGSMSHFKFSSLIFFKAVEQCVFQELVPELVNDVTYQFQITLLENFSTRSFDLRFRALNYQVANTLNIVGQSYSTNKERLSDQKIRTSFYRLLKWLEKQTKYRARLFTETEINSIFSNNKEIAPNADDPASASIPDGIYTLIQLMEFCNDGKAPPVSYLSLHYWINSFGSLLRLW
ncbi:uncharacterized protein LOC135844151 [Planococcus citri]|uniref:uncharacterized protein LOC135844151 n=1 Tax=Planococcus citri TaxID=170843 RepID=UPI0031F737FE